MNDAPWTGDACSLVDAFRRGDRTPVEEVEASLAAIEESDLNAFAFVDADAARTGLAEETDKKLAWVRHGAGDRFDELEYVEVYQESQGVGTGRARGKTSINGKLLKQAANQKHSCL